MRSISSSLRFRVAFESARTPEWLAITGVVERAAAWRQAFLDIWLTSIATTLVITANGSQDWFRDSLARVRKVHPALKEIIIEGSHHLHIEESSAADVAAQMRNFLDLKGP